MVECPDGRYSAELFHAAMEEFAVFEAVTCTYGAPLGVMVVGTLFYSGVALNIFLRTGSVMIPFVLALVLGGTIFAQMFAIINAFVAIIILLAAPMVMAGLIFLVDRQG